MQTTAMQTTAVTFAELIERVRTGSEDAARELVDSYGAHIIRAVRRRLSRQLRSKFDSEDFVQSVWKSFFVSLPSLHNLDEPHSLVAFLAQMASHKVIDENRRRLDTRRHDVRRETTLDESDPLVTRALGRQGPTPSEVAIAHEEWDRLAAASRERVRERDQQILRMRSEGHTYEHIAGQLEIHERTVRRVVRRKRKPPGK